MAHKLVEAVENGYMKKKDLPKIRIGDTVDVSVKIVEGEKTRTQVFTGTVIGRRGSGINQTVTVRRIVAGEGVERIFPLHSPAVSGIEAKRHGHARRAKLYYLRDRVGKKTRLREAQEFTPQAVKKRKAAEAAQARRERDGNESAADADE